VYNPTNFFECGQSLSLDSIGSFDLEGAAHYPVLVNKIEKVALKHCQIDEKYYSPYPKFPFHENQRQSPFYRTIKFNHPYRIYTFWNSQVQEKWAEPGQIARFLETRNRID
jgi:hypothetical protein